MLLGFEDLKLQELLLNDVSWDNLENIVTDSLAKRSIYFCLLDRGMNGWMDGGMDGGMDGWMDGRRDGNGSNIFVSSIMLIYKPAFSDDNFVSFLAFETGRNVGREVGVASLVSAVFGNIVEVISADDDCSLHFGGSNDTTENASTDAFFFKKKI